MKLIGQSFETPVNEAFTWLTNTLYSDDGTEQRISLLDPPVRSLQVAYNFTNETDARSLIRNMMMAQAGYQIPAYHRAVKVAPAAIGANALVFDRAATELRSGAPAVVFDRVSGALAVLALAVVGGAGATLAVPLAAAIGPRSRIALVGNVRVRQRNLSRARVNSVVTATVSLRSLDFVDPFLNPANTSVLEMFNGLPMLSQNAIGDQYDLVFNNGAALIDYGAATVIRSRWKHTQQQFARDFLSQRVTNPANFYYWHAFFDYCKGSAKPFYMPTHRPDFGIVGVAANNTVTLRGLDYGQDYFPFETFKQFSLFTGAGRHDTTVTNVASVGGNTVCTINPPLPNVAGYATNQIASLLLKCRIADDKVSMLHDPMQTVITLNMRTTDE